MIINTNDKSIINSKSFGQLFFESHTLKVRIILQPDLYIQKVITFA